MCLCVKERECKREREIGSGGRRECVCLCVKERG